MSSNREKQLLRLQLFGAPSVTLCGDDITRSLPKKAVLLLAILALRNGNPLDRHVLATQLWPEVPETAALHNLRQMLAGLRRSLGDAKDVITSPTPRSLSLPAGDTVWIDALEFDALTSSLNQDDLKQALSLYREPLLSACDEPFALAGREARQAAFLAAAEKVTNVHLRLGEHSAASKVLRRVLTEDPYRETACRSLMTALAAAGEWASAFDFFAEFRARLRRDLRIDVSTATKALYRELRRAASVSTPARKSKNALPTPITDLVGRDKAIAEIVAVLEICRLVTLVGVGGVGKTRLSIAAAEEIGDKLLDGACFVDLAPIQADSNIPIAIASALSLREVTGKPLFEVISEYVASREILLVLDNCEHLSEPVAQVVEDLLRASAGLRVLATSRQTLGVRGEYVLSVPGLTAPNSIESQDEILNSDAVRLFLKRSRRHIDESNSNTLVAVAAICKRLDGIPLAIELAAARTNLFSPIEINLRLDDRFSLLASTAQAVERHQTLRACMDWSWDSLSSDEKRLLMTISTFRGGGSLDTICNLVDDEVADPENVLSSLIDKSLVFLSQSHPTRYSLLETIREFAREKLSESGEWLTINGRHLDYYLAWVEGASRPQNSVDEAQRFATYELEHDNLRAAIDWCHNQNDRARAIRMCASLARFWDTHGHVEEGRSQLELALSQPATELPVAILRKALVHAGWMATVQGDCDAAIAHYNEALRLAKSENDQTTIGDILNCLAHAYNAKGDFDSASNCLLEALAIVCLVNPESTAMILCNLAEVAFCQGDDIVADRWMDEAAKEIGEISIEQATRSGTWLRHQAFASFRKGKHSEARDYALKSLNLFHSASLLYELPFGLVMLGLAEGGLGNWQRAITLYSAADKALEANGTTCSPYLAREKKESLETASGTLAPDAIAACARRGEAMNLAAAVEFAKDPDYDQF